MKLGYIGNFIPPFSTENDRRWAFEKLGHQVIPLQENRVDAQYILNHIPEVDLLIYSHTHDPDYAITGLRHVFDKYKEAGIPTASVHLDRWAGLARQSDMGQEATWFTEYIFMADGSPEAAELYDKLNLNWYYLPAAVPEQYAYMAKPNKAKYPHKIVFTGSYKYHPEYPFRKRLIDFLRVEYGSDFAHYGNDGIRVVRMDEQNILYASADIVVGDSCFGGQPQYVSDRYYEVRGRGGFLLHPHTEGIDTVGIAQYDRGDLNSLKDTIDYYLANPDKAQQMRSEGFEEVKANHTYTNRSKQLLEIIFESKK